MKHLLLLPLFLLFTTCIYAQSCEDYAVEIDVVTQVTPPKITLRWKRITGATSYEITKKAISSASWSGLATLTASDSTYTDAAVIVDSAYEYRIKAYGSGFVGAGYVYAAIKCPAIHNRGGLVLIVDSTYSDSCRFELQRLMKDISLDGWAVYRHDVPRSMKDTAVKALIRADYTANANVKAVLIVGHVAVPYSGDFNPDAHPDHKGAWPADCYYGTMTMTWTDASVDDTVASSAANRNRPGDGKWDQSALSYAAELQVGRIDLSNMPAFSSTELQRMKSYLNKDHIYKMDSLPMRKRAVLSDNFGAFSGEAFAANGWRNYAPLVGHDSIIATVPLIAGLDTSNFQFAYGTGGGSYTSAGGVGATTDFAASRVNGIFTMLFGSYFGDWNVTNNFLRAPLCSSTPALTCAWAGRPNWYIHHIALGWHIGYGMLTTINNTGSFSGYTYEPTGYAVNGTHVAFMGDLTLRTQYIKRASGVVITKVPPRGATISWTASPDAGVIGYYVYRATSEYGTYQRISNLVTTTSFRDSVGTTGLKYFMVRPVKLETTPSGGYYNLGLGVTDSATVAYISDVATIAAFTNVDIFPNPANDYLQVNIATEMPANISCTIVNTLGQKVFTQSQSLQTGANTTTIPVGNLPSGVYELLISDGKGILPYKWVKL
ncbi:MAG: T9SS C-terminal target domain-containing protein [Chitinophagia bacterium]|nr:T9SS C-terminal target domain-containing protein [Chitinophagia bacterium]